MIIVVNFEVNEDFSKTPLVEHLKQTLFLSNFFEALPELWKLDDLYTEDVCEYLRIRKTQLIYEKLWGISVDFSNTVGLITKEQFYPVIKY
jgi:hypothetical protein